LTEFEHAMHFHATRLERVFDSCFRVQDNTRLLGGAREPVYRPAASPAEYHRLYYREDFFASALHEIAHWCIAGRERRQRVDFGYWYAPEGRDAQQQKAFERVEVKPQALEWIFSLACGYPFRVSVDNLDPVSGQLADTLAFRREVALQAASYQRRGLPRRASELFAALRDEFGTGLGPESLRFNVGAID